MNWFKSPKFYPYAVTLTASILMMLVIATGQTIVITFPVLLLISAKLCVVFGAIEIGLSYIGRYENEEAYRAISRAISAFGMAMCFMLLMAAYEAAKR